MTQSTPPPEWTLLHYAVTEAPDLELARQALREWIDVDARTNDEFRATALHRAAGHGMVRGMIELLVQAGANIEARNARGRTPLHLAYRYGAPPHILDSLVAAGADRDAIDNYGFLPYQLATPHGQIFDLESDISGCAASHTTLLTHLQSIATVNVASPSRLKGWTIGHVLTHLAGNADSYRSLLEGGNQYEGDWDVRNALITQGAAREWSELIHDVEISSRRLDATFESFNNWSTTVPMLMGSQPARYLPLARRREVEVHRVDLGLGYELTDVPDDHITRDSRLLEAWWLSTQEPDTTLPPEIRDQPVRHRWAWLIGRTTIQGLPPSQLL